MQIYWGDIHNHNEIGYGVGSLRRSYEIAEGCLLDFYAFTPHGYWPDAPRDDPKIKKYHEEGYRKVEEAWPEVIEMAEKYNRDGKFVTLPAFEWHSSKSGDYCVYLPETDGATFPAENLDILKEFAKQYSALIIPHHIAYRPGCRGLDWNNFDPEFSPVVEAFSEHACSIETQTPWPMTEHSMGGQERSQTVFNQLNKGCFFGIIGSTDNHHGHPASYGEGLTGLYVEKLTRESVLKALKERRSVVVSGDRIEVFFSLGCALMGEFATPADNDSFEYSASGFGEIEFVQIIKNGIPVYMDIPGRELDKSGFAVRLEFGWGAMTAGDITDWSVEVSIKNGEILKLSPGFCGGADSKKINRVMGFTPQTVKFEAFTSRQNSNPVSSLAFRCQGESAEITVNCRSVYKGQSSENTIIAGTQELSEKDFWLRHGDEFSSPVMKLGSYSPLNTLELRGEWHDPEMKSGDWYMLKVQQKNGHIAWTSPIKIK
jgi:Protein of unknown function (DUF3604)